MMLTADSELRAQWLLRGGDTGTRASVEQSGAHGLRSSQCPPRAMNTRLFSLLALAGTRTQPRAR